MRRLQPLIDWFVQPAARITDDETIRRCRLLAALQVVLMLTGAMIIIVVLRQDPTDIGEPTVRATMALWVVVAVTYILDRLGYPRIAAAGMIVPFIALFIYVPFFSGEKPIFLIFLLVPILLIAIFFPLRWTAVTVAAILGLVLALVLLQPRTTSTSPFWDLRNLWFYLVLTSGLVLTFFWHLSNLEHIRERRLVEANERLEQDIALRLEAEKALRVSEARYRNLLENIPVTTYINGPEDPNPTEYVSPQVENLLGYTREDFLADPELWMKLLHPDDREAALIENTRTNRTEEPFHLDYRMIAKDGRPVWVRDDAVVVRDGLHAYWLGVWTDITERKHAENELQHLEQLYRRAIEAAGDVPYYRDFRTGKYTFMGEGILEITGYTAAEITPAIWESLEQEHHLRGELAELPYEEASRLTESGQIRRWECDYRIATRDGQIRWVADSAIQVRDESDARIGVIGILQDITVRRRAVEEIQRLNAVLEQRVRERTLELELANKELEAFSYSVSHDLRAPLRSIRGYSDILLKDFGQQLEPTAREYLARVGAAATDMGQLIDGLLSISRLSRSTLRRTNVDMTGIANDIIAAFRDQEPDRQVSWVATPGISAHADPALIRNVLENLLDNAWKYTSRMPEARIEFGTKREDSRTVYFIRDNGVGFDMRYADNLFGAFQRLHAAGEFPGHGIGLATVQRIVRRHGGEIWAEAQPDQGATFYFTLLGN